MLVLVDRHRPGSDAADSSRQRRFVFVDLLSLLRWVRGMVSRSSDETRRRARAISFRGRDGQPTVARAHTLSAR